MVEKQRRFQSLLHKFLKRALIMEMTMTKNSQFGHLTTIQT